jgi:WD40 repeat protein
LPDIRVLQEWEGNPQGTNGLAFDARLTRYAWSSAAEGIRVRRLEDHKELFRLPLLAANRPDPWVHLNFSPTGRFLTVVYAQRTPHRLLEVWELKPGESRRFLELEGVSGDPAFSHDESTLAVGLPSGQITLYDLPGGQPRAPFLTGAVAEMMAFSPDGQALAVASIHRAVVEIHELLSGKIVRTLRHETGVQSVAWCPQGSDENVLPQLASGCRDQRIYLWSSRDGTPPRLLEGHGWEVPQLTFDSTGNRLLSFGWDMTLRLWDVPARRLTLTQPGVRVLGFCTEGSLRAASLQGTQVRILDLVPSGEHHVFHGHQERVFQIGFHPSHDWLASGGLEQSVRLWDVHSGRELARLHHPDGMGRARTVLWESSGQGLLTSLADVSRWPVLVRPGLGKRHARIGPPAHLLGIEDHITRMVWSGPGDRYLALNNVNVKPGFRLFQLDGRAKEVLHFSEEKATFLSASPDGHWLATGTADEGHGIRIWDARSGKREKAWDWGDADVAFSPDGQWLVAATGRLSPQGAACYSWRVGSWEEARKVSLNRPASAPAVLAFSPDSRVLAVTSSMTDIRLIRPDTFEEIATLTAPETQLIVYLAFSADGSHRAAAAGKTIHVWDLRAIRTRLRELDLDWHGPDYPAARGEPEPWTIEVDQGPAGK